MIKLNSLKTTKLKLKMSSVEELPSKLEKLEISPIAPQLPQIQLMECNLPIGLNPFYTAKLNETDPTQPDASAILFSTVLNGEQKPRRSCRTYRPRYNSESVADDIKNAINYTEDSAIIDKLNIIRSVPGVQRPTFKKANALVNGKRKSLLCPPILDALQSSVQSQHNARKTQQHLEDEVSTVCNDTVQISEVSNVRRDTSDFKVLIDDCRKMLVQDVDFNKKFKKLNLGCRCKSKNFTTIQKTKEPNIRTKPCSGCDINNGNDNKLKLIPLNSIKTRTASPSRSSTSCSQQAGNTAKATASNTADDVTVDELASYFDTFVHIPKKMSQMAEMMYI